MYQTIFIGLLLIAMGALSSGSFAIPFSKIIDWESYWLVFSLGAYIIFPLTSCLMFSTDVPPQNIIAMFNAVNEFNKN